MNWFEWLLVVWLTLGAISTTAQVGKEREPITNGVAVASTIICALLILGILLSNGVHL